MTTTTEVRTPAPTTRHFALAVLALAVGGFAIGTTEFVTMGLLPQISEGVGVSIPQAGHVIAAYALGVVVGAPLLAFFGARWPRRGLLVVLMGAYALFNALSAVATSFELLAVARFLDGLPHGGYFGVASLVAASMVSPERRGRAIAWVLLGLPVANVVGVPLATVLGQHLGWRASYWLVALLAALTMVLVVAFVPACPGNPEATGRRELAALGKPQVWLTMVAGAVGFGGMFALFSYIAPTVTEVSGLPGSAVPVFLLTLGVGMVVGNWAAGVLVDRSVLGSLLGSSIGLGVVLLGFWATAPHGWLALPAAFAVTFVGSVLALSMMIRLIDVAGHAETLGAAMSHSSLNVGNALGAWLGGLVIASGLGFRAPILVGVALAVAGFLVVLVSAAVQSRRSEGARG
ncbi:MFS transporter [Nocardioides sp.]|uniref:MFS transporter n=1 Tax=Nocardioides sp. TaxID=35761 RepID=UPI002D7FE219|nr:MFS transporter [Nocardioides sp.]HET8960026.1 MFS transporter [Nocardioides sp.]